MYRILRYSKYDCLVQICSYFKTAQHRTVSGTAGRTFNRGVRAVAKGGGGGAEKKRDMGAFMGFLEACPPRKCSKLEARKISFLPEIWGGGGGGG